MLISKRRLRWLSISLLIACLLLLLRPTRNWIDRWAVAHFVGPQIRVGELLLHPKYSLVEARELSWVGVDQNRRFELNVGCGWFGYDQLGLIDRHTRLPKVILQSADLRLDRVVAVPGYMDVWKQHLARQVSQLDWSCIEGQLGCLTSTRELKRLWSSNIERWVSRSQQILAEADHLERQTDRMDNPLRFELSLHEKLNSLQQLAGEQASLMKRFDDLSEQIDAETARLHELHGRDQIKLAGLVIGNTSYDSLTRERVQLCRELAHGLGHTFWRQTACYAEIIDQVLQASQGNARPSYDVNIRSNRHGNEWLALSDWRASGEFNCGGLTTPYKASGNWLLTQEPSRPRQLELVWQATFYREQSQIEVRTQHASQRSPQTHWEILQGPQDSATASKPMLNSPAPIRSRLELNSQFGKLQGTAALTASTLSRLAQELNTQWHDSESASALTTLMQAVPTGKELDGQPLEFDVDGTWSDASLHLRGDVPTWLSQSVATAIDRRVQVASDANRQRLDHEFDSQLSELQKLVAVAVADCRSLTAHHGQQLLATQDRVQRQLADMTGTEFARRPAAINR